MLAKVLSTVIQATLTAIRQECGWNLTVEQIYQLDERDLTFEAIAAAHYTQGPIRRIILGCDCELARHTMKRNRSNPDIHKEISGEISDETSDQTSHQTSDQTSREFAVQSAEHEADVGVELICHTLQESLAISLGLDGDNDKFILHDSEKFRVRTEGTRNFYIYVPTPAGDLHLVVDLSNRGEPMQARFHGTDNYKKPAVIPSTKSEATVIDNQGDIDQVINNLFDLEENILIKFGEGDMSSIHRGTVLRLPSEPENNGLTISSACLLDNEFTYPVGKEVVVVFMHQDQLLQFESRISDVFFAELAGCANLPLISLAPPVQITPGQRRCAFRVVPSTRILGSIKNTSEDDTAINNQQGSSISILVKDLSDTGTRVAMTDRTLLSNFKWGSEVSCSFKLPEGYGSVEIRGIIQRVLLYPDNKQRRKAHLGIEFIQEPGITDNGLEKIRKYIRNQQREALKGRISVLPNTPY